MQLSKWSAFLAIVTTMAVMFGARELYRRMRREAPPTRPLMVPYTGSFAWVPYQQEQLDRLPASISAEGADRAQLEVRMVPQFDDPRLRESLFVIIATAGEREQTLYKGPYAETLRISAPPLTSQALYLAFRAFHAPTQTAMSWTSKNHTTLPVNRPLRIELYSEYRLDADGWFYVSAASP